MPLNSRDGLAGAQEAQHRQQLLHHLVADESFGEEAT
jgi:hypothetical protein